MVLDFHGYQRKLDRKIEEIKGSANLLEENKNDILKFKNDCISEGLTIPRIEKLISSIYYLGLIFEKPFKSATNEDVKSLVGKIETNELANFVNRVSKCGKNEWSDWTKRDYRVVLKKFYKWLTDDENPPQIKGIKSSARNGNHRLPEEILTEEEIKRMVEAADNTRDRALVLVLYESGCRIGELVTLRLKHVQFDEYGAVLLVRGKTGSRRVRIIASAPSLSCWLEQHPQRDDPESFLWLTKFSRMNENAQKNEIKPNYTQLDYAGIRKFLQILAKRAGIRKRVNPHSFRHARATHLAKDLTEAQMKEMFGWTQSSNMASIYVHLSGRDVDNALLKVHGLVENERTEHELRPVRCSKCKETNDSVSQFCKRCGSPLSLKMLLEIEEKRSQFDNFLKEFLVRLSEKDENTKEVFNQVVKEKGLESLFSD